MAAGEALTAPAWEAVVSLLVPRRDLPMAVAANSVSVNISRAVGPALGGALLGAFGVSTPFLLNAVSNVGVIGALAWWPEPVRARSKLPPEHFASAMITGVRHARYNRHLIGGSTEDSGSDDDESEDDENEGSEEEKPKASVGGRATTSFAELRAQVTKRYPSSK